MPSMFKTPMNDVRSYMERPTIQLSQKTSHPTKPLVAASESTTTCAQPAAVTSQLPEGGNIASTSSTDTSVTLLSKCEEVVRDMFPNLEQEKITKALMDSNMNVEGAITIILGETDKGMCYANCIILV